MRRHNYWEAMASDVHKHLHACVSCSRNRLTERGDTSKLRLFPAADSITSLSMVIQGPIPETSSGTLYLIIICDRFSKFTRAIPLKIITALDVTSAFCEYRLASHGPSDSFLTDKGPQFASVFI